MSLFCWCWQDVGIFMHVCVHFDDVVISGNRRYEPFFWLKFLLDSTLSYESLEGLVDLLALLFPKLWSNFRKIIREIPTNPLGNARNTVYEILLA